MGINQLMQYGYAELKYIIDWAKKVPGKWWDQLQRFKDFRQIGINYSVTH